MLDEFTPGVYMIVNTVTGVVYVGSSSKIGSRITGHRSALNRGKHTVRNLQADWIKYGAEAFEFSVLEIVAAKSDRVLREQYWVDTFGTFGEIYNVMRTVGVGGGRISAEMQRAITRVALGETSYAAAKAEGVTSTAIRRSPLYRELLAAGKVVLGKPGRK